MFKFIFMTPSRYWREQAAAENAKVQTLNSRLSELRERFMQAQREIETGQVRFEETYTRPDLSQRFFQRQCQNLHRQLGDLRATRDAVQMDANDNVLVETSGLDEALKVTFYQIQFHISNTINLFV
jgi:hypothetical protein